jgi:hypothetical protein
MIGAEKRLVSLERKLIKRKERADLERLHAVYPPELEAKQLRAKDAQLWRKCWKVDPKVRRMQTRRSHK